MTATLRGYTLRGTYADLPRSRPNPALPTGWTGAANFTPTTDAELGTALTNAAAASGLQIIELAANTTITGVSRSLPVKVDNYPIVIRTSAFASLPERRITTSDAALLATIESSATNPWCITSAFGAHDYYFVGIKITRPNTGTNPTTLVRLGLGGGSTDPTSPTQLPTRIYFDRCWIQGPDSINITAGIRFDVNTGAITRCRIANIKSTGNDTQAINIINNSPGNPIWIHNNYLESTGENIMFGGSNPPLASWPFNVWDVTITKNYFSKPLTWCNTSPTFAGTDYSVKNIFELKCGRRILLEGNIFEHMWGPDQDGSAINFKSSMDPSSTLYAGEYGTADITMRYNIIRHCANAFRIAGVADGAKHRSNRYYIHDNLCYGLYESKGINWAGTSDHNFMVFDRAFEVMIDHNTFYSPSTTNYTVYVENNLSKIKIRNNLFFRSSLGVRTSGQNSGNDSLNTAVPGGDYVVDYNAFPNVSLASYPANNFAPNTVSAIGYTNATNDDDGDYSLSSGSSYKNAGSDGRDLGCDITKVLYHTSGVDA